MLFGGKLLPQLALIGTQQDAVERAGWMSRADLDSHVCSMKSGKVFFSKPQCSHLGGENGLLGSCCGLNCVPQIHVLKR